MLKYTEDQARTRIVDMIGVKGIPNPWWGLGYGNDCVGFVLERLGIRTRTDYTASRIGIAAFRAHYGWDEVAASQLQAGDLVAENWTGARDHTTGRLVPEHLEYVYSADHGDGQAVTVAANTGPRPGTAAPRGAWKKTRPIDSHLLFGIRPPYKTAAPSRTRKATVRRIASYLNTHVPHGPARTAAVDDGIEGPNYWRLVQAWGRTHDLYGPNYRIDGIPGPRTRQVEAAVLRAATVKGKH